MGAFAKEPSRLCIPSRAARQRLRLIQGANSGVFTVPAKMPAAPSPEIALPTMNANELGAAPQRAEAVSNSRILVRKVLFTEYKVYNLPYNNWNAQFVNKYALPYQPTSSRELNSSVI